MKKYIILLFLVFSCNIGFSQCEGTPPPPPECDCENCCHLLGLDADCEYTVKTPEYETCADANNCTTVPIDSAILILILLGVSFGIYKVNLNKKRQLEN